MARGFIYNEDNDLVIENGGFKIGEAEQDCIMSNLIAVPGHFKNEPRLGASIIKLQNGVYNQTAKRKLQKALERDNFSINQVNIEVK